MKPQYAFFGILGAIVAYQQMPEKHFPECSLQLGSYEVHTNRSTIQANITPQADTIHIIRDDAPDIVAAYSATSNPFKGQILGGHLSQVLIGDAMPKDIYDRICIMGVLDCSLIGRNAKKVHPTLRSSIRSDLEDAVNTLCRVRDWEAPGHTFTPVVYN
ncbi:hypothetical protein H6504_00185 [Candidatus Woesearchaeota archaeon]|nr:hypothetical protein [Candidatus Woesearchaeota archaeon]